MVCTTPANPSVSNTTDTTATLTWDAVAGATNYIINYKPVTTNVWTAIGTGGANSWQLTGLAPGNTFDWKVKADCGGEESNFSITTQFITTGTYEEISVCPYPENSFVRVVTDRQVIFCWDPVSDIDRYIINFRPVGTGNWLVLTSTNPNGETANLIPSTQYEWKVKAECSNELNSPFSPTQVFSTLSDRITGAGNLLANAGGIGTTDWMDSDSDGLADYWWFWPHMKGGDFSVVTGNGFNGSAQRMQVTGTRVLIRNTFPFEDNVMYRVSFKYRSNINWGIKGNTAQAPGIQSFYGANLGNAQAVSFTATSNSNDNGIYIDSFTGSDNTPGDWIEIDEIVVEKLNGTVSDITEIQALRDLYESTNGDSWTSQTDADPSNDWPSGTQWDTVSSITEAANWFGVTVSNGDLMTLSLESNNLSGPLPSSIGNLTRLSQLKLSSNSLTSSIPASLSSLSNLSRLHLDNNNFSGAIPASLGQLAGLQYLLLHTNNLTGEIPGSLGALNNLHELHIGQNDLTGNLPDSLQYMSALRKFTVSNNLLSGNIPSWLEDLSLLQVLTLGNNQLTGQIPPELGNMANLEKLWLYQNNLSGQLPATLGNLSNLNSLYLHVNSLTGKIPDSFDNLIAMRELLLSHNEFTGPVPNFITTYADLLDLKLVGSNFTSFPDFHGHTNPSAITVDIRSNFIPQAHIDANFDGANHIFASFAFDPQNTANGNVPDVVEIQALRDFYESTGGDNWTSQTDGNTSDDWPSGSDWDTINVVDNLSSLKGLTITNGDVTSISLTQNNLSGVLPQSLGNLASLVQIRIDKNNLTTTSFDFLNNLNQLTKLQIHDNNFTGPFPPQILGMTQLVELFINTNSFSGEIPAGISNLTQLKVLTLSFNNFTGIIPDIFGSLPNLEKLQVRSNQLVDPLPSSIASLSNLLVLDLSLNDFSGTIPQFIGNLPQLTYLDLGTNHFEGFLPNSFQNLQNLEQIYLGNNKQIRGDIPEEIILSPQLKRVFFQNTSLSTLPDFTNHPNAANLELTVYNAFDFSDYERNMTAPDIHPFQVYNYGTSQRTVHVADTIGFTSGQSAIIPSDIAGINTTYRWFKKEGANWIEIANEDQPELAIPAASLSDEGFYRCIADNSWVTGINFRTNEIYLSEGFVNPQGSVSDNIEIQALRDLYQATNGDNWTSQTDADPSNDWPSGTAWDTLASIDQVAGLFGLTVENGDLTGIVLPDNSLSGTLPSSLGSLTALNILSVRGNLLVGTLEPWLLDNLINLIHLELEGNNYTGIVPESIGNLTQLQILNFREANFSGPLPQAIGTLTDLTLLRLEKNFFEGTVPSSYQNLTALQTFVISGNKLEGVIPDWIGGLTNLKIFSLTGNDFSGPIPLSFGNLTDLTFFGLGVNNLSGAIPEFITSFSNLRTLDLQSNNFTSFPDFHAHLNPGAVSVNIQHNFIPQSHIDANFDGANHIFASFTYDPQNTPNGLVPDATEIQALRDLYESTNGDNWTIQTDSDPNNDWPSGNAWDTLNSVDQITGLFGITVANGDVTRIEIEGKNLTGSIPASIGDLTSLIHLHVRWNNLSGSIPAEIGNLQTLSQLFLEDNDLSGPIPESIGNMSGLRKLFLNKNQLTGTIPDTLYTINLTWLYLSFNQLSGGISDLVGNLTTLERLVLNGNNFTGGIPSSIGNLTNLEQFQVQGNQLTGTIPASVSNLTNLTNFLVYINNLSGDIPHGITNSPDLVSLWLYDNNFTSFPDFHGHPNAANMDVQIQNNFIPQADINANFDGASHIFASFIFDPQKVNPGVVDDAMELQALTDLYNATNGPNWTNNDNWLVGTTSTDLSGWHGITVENGDVTRVELINNQLQGSLPSSTGDLSQLTYLRFTLNALTGSPPATLGNLSNLTYLNLANNQFTGPAPQEIANLTLLQDLLLDDNTFSGMPDFSGHPSPQVIQVTAHNNQLGFADFEPNFSAAGTLFESLTYANQQPEVAEDIQTVPEGLQVPLDATDGAQTNYQWQVGVNGAWMDLSGETNPTYNASLQPGQVEGRFRCAKTNNWVTGVTFYSTEYVLRRLGNLPDLAENNPDENSNAPATGILSPPATNLTTPAAINFVRTLTPRAPQGISNEAQVTVNSSAADVQVSTQYLDGLGRPIQTVIRGESPDQDDVIQPIEYDAFGRQEKEYLPYSSTATFGGAYQPNALRDQYDFYHAGGDNIADTDYPFTFNGFENSPLNRILAQAAPGENWRMGSGHELQFTQRSNNNAQDGNIPLWTINETNNLPQTSASYGENELLVQETVDEHGNLVIEYTDKRGRVVLKKVEDEEDGMGGATDFLETHYVYDDFDQLRAVIPPQAIRELEAAGNFSINDVFRDKWLFSYRYDGRRRMIEKQVPGAEPMLMIYNNRDLLILSQDGNQRLQNQWTFTKYDQLNRPVMTGIYRDNQDTTPAALITEMNKPGKYTLIESRTTAAINNYHGYTNDAFPKLNLNNGSEVYTLTYYDDYDFYNDGSPDYSYQTSGLSPEPVADSRTKTLVTGSKTKVLGSSQFLVTANFYDEFGRVIQTQSDNIQGGTDILTTRYDYVGTVLETRLQHSGTESHTLDRSFSYDHADRLTSIDHSLNGATFVPLAQNQYNELGELTEKILGNNLQTVDYLYNIRGWLTHINDAELSDASDYFGMELYYDYGYDKNAFNGNIAGVRWQSALDQKQRTYGYLYDPVNRILGAAYTAKGPAGWVEEYNNYCMGEMQYDGNGNILRLARNGQVDFDPISSLPVHEIMDSLLYSYDGNQLQAVNDIIDNGAKDRGDFYDGAELATEYVYDDNGNMTSDANKDITAISYNYLNLPQQITFADGNQLLYTYDAAGVKHQQEVIEGGQTTKTTEYLGEFIYEDNVLQYIQHEEGRVLPSTPEGVEYQFYHKDHLGNIRMTFTAPKPPVDFTATMEPGNEAVESVLWTNLDTRFIQQQANSTPSGQYAARLNSSQPVGPAMQLKVGKGDKVDIDAIAYYLDNSGFGSSTTLAAMTAAVAGAFGGVSGGSGESGLIYDAIDFGLNLLGLGGNNGDNQPAAYLSYLLFDDQMVYRDGGYMPVTTAAHLNQETIGFTTLEISENGYLYVYVSYENQSTNEVFFDDIQVTLTESPIVQENHYYPFGLTLTGIGKQGSNPWKFGEQEEQNELNLSWYGYRFRSHDPALGRFIQIDPLADDFPYNSTYSFSENKLGLGVELEGLELKRARGGVNELSGGLDIILNEKLNVERQQQLNQGGQQKDRAEVERLAEFSKGREQIRSGVVEAAKGTTFLAGETLETGGNVVRNGAVIAAPFTGGATLTVAGAADRAANVGTALKVAVDLSDGNSESLIEAGATIAISKVTNKLVDKAVERTNSTTPNRSGNNENTQRSILQNVQNAVVEFFKPIIDLLIEDDD